MAAVLVRVHVSLLRAILYVRSPNTRYFAPDAPWWLVRKNRVADAEKALQRLVSPNMYNHIPGTVQNSESLCKSGRLIPAVVRTYQLEVDISAGARWIDCFKGTDLRRTEIAAWAFMNQSLCGDPFGGQQIYFRESA